MTEGEVADLVTICHSFPNIPSPEVRREVALDAVDRLFLQGYDIVVVEGEEGIGKTILLSQFSRKYHDRTLSLFVRSSRLAHDPDVLRYDLANQLEWILNERELHAIEEATPVLLRNRLMGLQKLARRGPVNFVVDGLCEIPGDIIDLVLSMLPLDLRGFRFLFSGEAQVLVEHMVGDLVPKPYTLGAFSLSETRELLADLELEPESVEELHQCCGKLPGHLSSARRSLLSGVDVSVILANSDWFEIEWGKVRFPDDVQENALAVLAFGQRPYTTAELGRITAVSPGEVEDALQGLRFIDSDMRSALSFVTESFRRFAQGKLRHCEEKARELIIQDLMRDPESGESLTDLPEWLERAGKLGELLEYLSPTNLIRVLEQRRSLAPVRQKTDLGIRAARSENRLGDLLRFALQKSTVIAIGEAQVWRSEVKALMSLGDYQGALALAQSVVLSEDRLHLLAVIARAKREQGLEPEPELQEQLRHLYNTIDATGLGSRAVDIAVDLVFSNVELAIDLVEKASTIPPQDSSHDWALARLSAAVAQSEDGARFSERIQQRIKDPVASRFASITTVMIGDHAAAEAIRRVSSEKLKDQLYLLSQWILHNRERPDAVEVVSAAFQIAIRMTSAEYLPARDLRRIATALPFVRDAQRARQLVRDFDGQLGLVERTGPTEDYVRLQLLLAQTERSYDTDHAVSRITEIYGYILGLSDIVVKATCLARLVGELSMPELSEISRRTSLEPPPLEQLEHDIRAILATTAEQEIATQGIVAALGRSHPDLAHKLIVQRLNTVARRDGALFHLLGVITDQPLDKIDFGFVLHAIDELVDRDLVDEAIRRILIRLAQDTPIDADTLKEIVRIIDRVPTVADPTLRCQSCCTAYTILAGSGMYAERASRILNTLRESWQRTDALWNRVNVGYLISDSLASPAYDSAKEYLALTDALHQDSAVDTADAALTYLACAQLAIRAFGGLLPRRLDTDRDLEDIRLIVGNVPSIVHRVRLWVQLALQYDAARRLDDCRSIVVQHIQPLIQEPGTDQHDRDIAVLIAAPALYRAHPATAIQYFSQLRKSDKESAVAATCLYLIRKTPSGEPYNAPLGRNAVLTSDDMLDILNLMASIDRDQLLYVLIEAIADSVDAKHSTFSREHIHYVASTLEEIIKAKLPDRANIQHDGYVVIAKGQVARIRKAQSSVWLDLVAQAQAIENPADQAYVQAVLAKAMPKRESSRSKELLGHARQTVEQLPFGLDRLRRYQVLADSAVQIDRDFAKGCIRAAVALPPIDDDEYNDARKDLVDLAYAMDEDFAASIAEALDDDPARRQNRLRERLQIHEMQRRIVGQQDISGDSLRRLPQAAWMLLGGLNGGNVRSVHITDTLGVLETAGSMSVEYAYPIMSWVIQNAKVRYADTEQAQEYLQPLFRACVLGAHLAAQITTRSSEQVRNARLLHQDSPVSVDGVFRAGDREKVMAYLRRWFEDHVAEYLKICDPYFGPEQLDILSVLAEVKPECVVEILTSQEHHRRYEQPWRDVYRQHWRSKISSVQDPPDTYVSVVGTKAGKLPIHDRWWLTKGAGLRMGPYGHLGITRTSEISQLEPNKLEGLEQEIDSYLHRRTRTYDGEPLTYDTFTL